MKFTNNYNLKKPDGSDVVNINDLNENADKIDSELAKRVDKVTGKGLSTNDYSNAEKQKVANNKSTIDTHIADDDLIKHKAKQIELQDTANLFASTNVEAGMGELFTNVSNGKDLVSGAITGVDDSVVIPTEPSFGDLAGAIGGISTGKKWASGILTGSYDVNNYPRNQAILNGIPFTVTNLYAFKPYVEGNYNYALVWKQGGKGFFIAAGNGVYSTLSELQVSQSGGTVVIGHMGTDLMTGMNYIVFGD